MFSNKKKHSQILRLSFILCLLLSQLMERRKREAPPPPPPPPIPPPLPATEKGQVGEQMFPPGTRDTTTTTTTNAGADGASTSQNQRGPGMTNDFINVCGCCCHWWWRRWQPRRWQWLPMADEDVISHSWAKNMRWDCWRLQWCYPVVWSYHCCCCRC